MRKASHAKLSIASALAFLAVGIPYWRVPYADLGLPDSILTPALLLTLSAAALARIVGDASFWRATVVVGVSVPGAILIRMLVEVLADPGTHNLWPFELILACCVGFPVAFAGALLGSGFLRVRGNAGRHQGASERVCAPAPEVVRPAGKARVARGHGCSSLAAAVEPPHAPASMRCGCARLHDRWHCNPIHRSGPVARGRNEVTLSTSQQRQDDSQPEFKHGRCAEEPWPYEPVVKVQLSKQAALREAGTAQGFLTPKRYSDPGFRNPQALRPAIRAGAPCRGARLVEGALTVRANGNSG
jgi:hypothetical protein